MQWKWDHTSLWFTAEWTDPDTATARFSGQVAKWSVNDIESVTQHGLPAHKAVTMYSIAVSPGYMYTTLK